MRRRTLKLLIAFVAIAVSTRWLSLVVDVVDLDETCHIVGAWEVLRGGLLYTDFVDNKPPLVYVYYAAAQLLAGRGLFAVHLVTACCVVPLTALAVSACYRHTRVGLVAAVTFLLYSVAFIAHDMLATNAEVLMVLPATWAIVLVGDEARRACAVARPRRGTAVRRGRAVQAAGGRLDRRRRRRARVAGVGTRTRLEAVKLVSLWRRRVRSARGDARVPLGARRTRRLPLLGGRPEPLVRGHPITLREAVTRLAATSCRSWSSPRPCSTPGGGASSGAGAILAAAAVGARCLVGPARLLGFRFYPHYFIQFYVPLSLTSAPWLERQLSRPVTRAGRVVVAWTAVVVAGFAIANAAST